MGATGLTPGQKNWSIFETELLSVVWALEHARYYCIGAPKITVRTDHSPLKGLFKKDLSEIDNPRVVKLLERPYITILRCKQWLAKTILPQMHSPAWDVRIV